MFRRKCIKANICGQIIWAKLDETCTKIANNTKTIAWCIISIHTIINLQQSDSARVIKVKWEASTF